MNMHVLWDLLVAAEGDGASESRGLQVLRLFSLNGMHLSALLGLAGFALLVLLLAPDRHARAVGRIAARPLMAWLLGSAVLLLVSTGLRRAEARPISRILIIGASTMVPAFMRYCWARRVISMRQTPCSCPPERIPSHPWYLRPWLAACQCSIRLQEASRSWSMMRQEWHYHVRKTGKDSMFLSLNRSVMECSKLWKIIQYTLCGHVNARWCGLTWRTGLTNTVGFLISYWG